MTRIILAILLVSLHTGIFAQSKKASFNPSSLALTWGVIENNHNNETASLTELVLTNKGRQALPKSGWKIYFNFVRDIREEGVTGNVEIRQVNGDLFYIAPKSISASVPARGKIDFVSSDWVVISRCTQWLLPGFGWYHQWHSHQQSWLIRLRSPSRYCDLTAIKLINYTRQFV